MGFGIQHFAWRPHLLRHRSSSMATDVPKGHLAVYVGESQRRFVIPLSYLKHASFQSLLQRVEEEIGFQHPMGGLTIPFAEDEYFQTPHISYQREANTLEGDGFPRVSKLQAMGLNLPTLLFCGDHLNLSGHRNHKPSPALTNIDCKMAFGYVDGHRRRLVSSQVQPADEAVKPDAHDFLRDGHYLLLFGAGIRRPLAGVARSRRSPEIRQPVVEIRPPPADFGDQKHGKAKWLIPAHERSLLSRVPSEVSAPFITYLHKDAHADGRAQASPPATALWDGMGSRRAVATVCYQVATGGAQTCRSDKTGALGIKPSVVISPECFGLRKPLDLKSSSKNARSIWGLSIPLQDTISHMEAT
ncbi:hypothetical protein Taro_029780 [Colocasia esculenta]|uniref:Uncharacterized protein n=1 Tax=Colocasia esculenta TaxID=4460 RepID=A0A843VEP6_COLES|nr:hypothetical protein [Colocasia esculenta]